MRVIDKRLKSGGKIRRGKPLTPHSSEYWEAFLYSLTGEYFALATHYKKVTKELQYFVDNPATSGHVEAANTPKILSNQLLAHKLTERLYNVEEILDRMVVRSKDNMIRAWAHFFQEAPSDYLIQLFGVEMRLTIEQIRQFVESDFLEQFFTDIPGDAFLAFHMGLSTFNQSETFLYGTMINH